MAALQIAVCEDDESAACHLLTLLKTSRYRTETTRFSSAEAFVSEFHPHQYDLIIMDIFMDEMTGIQAITHVRTLDAQVPVVFVTISKDYALASYRLNAIKYMEKPVQQSALEEALQMAYLKRQTMNKLVLRVNNSTRGYLLIDVLFLEQKGRALLVRMRDGTEISVNKKLVDMEEQLLEKGFLRCHKSYLVNLALVCGIDRELSVFEMVDGSKVYIRKKSFGEMQKAFEAYLFVTEQEDPHE